jgi:hypothetical protein
MWDYKRTNKVFEGCTVYKAYCFGEFSHYCYKEPAYQLQPKKVIVHGKPKTMYKEVRKGSKHTPFNRVRFEENGRKYFISHEELANEFETRKTKSQVA